MADIGPTRKIESVSGKARADGVRRWPEGKDAPIERKQSGKERNPNKQQGDVVELHAADEEKPKPKGQKKSRQPKAGEDPAVDLDC